MRAFGFTVLASMTFESSLKIVFLYALATNLFLRCYPSAPYIVSLRSIVFHLAFRPARRNRPPTARLERSARR